VGNKHLPPEEKSWESNADLLYEVAVDLPESVRMFVIDFDKGKFPDLVAGTVSY
jgi:hypothetical protein